MAGKGRSGRGGVCRSGGTRSRAAELLSTKKTCPQERLRAGVLSCHSRRPHRHCVHHQRLVDRPPSLPRHPPASAGLHDLGPGRPGAAVAQGRHRCAGPGPRRRGLAGHRLPLPARGLGGDRPTIPPRSPTSWTGSAGTASRSSAWTGPWSALTGSPLAPRPATTCGTPVGTGPSAVTCRS